MNISIITITKNAEKEIERTLFSVAQQTFPVEYIVVDGASEDGTAAIVERYRHTVSRFISEPDSGIYHAMNKGIRAAAGDYCLFLNAGDYLAYPAAIANAVAAMSETEPADVFYGCQLMIHQRNGASHIWRPRKKGTLDFFSGSLPHASSFICRKAFDRIGLYDESFRIAGDYEWFVRAFTRGIRFIALSCLVAVFLQDEGISTHPKQKELQKLEMQRVRELYFHGFKRTTLQVGLFLRKNKIL
ncbi:MAG: glycosyltransferase [candidate division KSB1 bacterium]|nr:glycosyltransferase [candidate division KSB1 bacterium]